MGLLLGHALVALIILLLIQEAMLGIIDLKKLPWNQSPKKKGFRKIVFFGEGCLSGNISRIPRRTKGHHLGGHGENCSETKYGPGAEMSPETCKVVGFLQHSCLVILVMLSINWD